MQLNFCTLFDSNYLSRGIVLYESLVSVCPEARLYVLAFDDVCADFLDSRDYSNMTVISLGAFEDSEMLRIKSDRTRTEYCWTCASHFTRYCILTFDLAQCTYIDADMVFYNHPSIIFDESPQASVYITPHRYTPAYDMSKLSGIYCVQFVSFKGDQRGMRVLNWWCEACAEWCYNRFEDGKFGDQKYLDDWPERFEGVHVVKHPGAGIAVWNLQQYTCFQQAGELTCETKASKESFAPIFFHFHYLKFYKDQTVELGRKVIGEDFLRLFYRPYINRLLQTKESYKSVIPIVDINGTQATPRGLKHMLISLWRKTRGVHHIYPVKKFIETYG